jgi:hypothetical protein
MRAPTALGLLLFAGIPLLAGPAPVRAAETPRQEAERLTRENEILKRHVELSRGDAFYMVLDPNAMRLKLYLRGAVLQDYKVEGLEVGEPRVAFVSRGLPEEWEGRIWTAGRLDPPREQERVEMVAPPPSAEETEETAPAPPIPRTPEEAYPVPTRYHIRYVGGLALEVSPGTVVGEPKGFWSGLGHAWRAWWADVRAAASREPKDTVRLRMTLRTEDAKSLYRALPPDTKLLVVPPAA